MPPRTFNFRPTRHIVEKYGEKSSGIKYDEGISNKNQITSRFGEGIRADVFFAHFFLWQASTCGASRSPLASPPSLFRFPHSLPTLLSGIDINYHVKKGNQGYSGGRSKEEGEGFRKK